jgi:hypothetical protein
MPSNETDTLYLESPIVPVSVFGRISEQIEYNLSELLEDINQATDSRGDDRIHHAMSLIAKSNALHTLLLAHLERQIALDRLDRSSKKSPNS